MEIKRYTVFTNIDENGKPHKPHISENKSGGWVKYKDVEKIIKNEKKRLELIQSYKDDYDNVSYRIKAIYDDKLEALEECEVEDENR